MPAHQNYPQMKKAETEDGFQEWPFRAEGISPDGDRNNGGIDLIAEPHRIDEIHEATTENGLRYVLEALNAPGGLFMSLGCLSAFDDLYHSYVEFTFRDHVSAIDESNILAIHERWQSWLAERDAEIPGLAQATNLRSAWDYRAFSLRGNAPQYLITVYHREHDAESHAKVVQWFERFLLEVEHSF
ncbi:hypothetical protein [Pseudomonas sp. OV226]|uniref:hypothetical protein n=1 Tax=Pseudomonas sp. OV226 TaxID=2135588 RepID=UPI000D6B77F6|nr:hypothetical protein [Pseudomonas sp. OV226]PWK42204.1 hypothetical protein C7534_10511 [Pseudomonas sp. OV226]